MTGVKGRRAALAIAVALAVLVAAACTGNDPSTAGTTTTTVVHANRYREEVFDDVEVVRGVEYGSAPGVDGQPETLVLDLYLPVDDTETARPLAIFVHGGGFGFGDKAQGVSPVMADLFARLGYVAASVNYRLLAPGGCVGSDSGESRCTDAVVGGIHDGQAAVRFLRANAETYGIDPDRIAIAGESAGAIIAYGAGTWSEEPGDSGTPGVPSEVQAWQSLSGGLPGGLFAGEGDAPGILFASIGDPIVPHQWSVEAHDALAAAGVPVELVSYEGDVHVPFREQRDDIVQRTIDWYAEHLDLD